MNTQKKVILGLAVLVLCCVSFHFTWLTLERFAEEQAQEIILEAVSHELAEKEFSTDLKSGTTKKGSELNLNDYKKALYVLTIRNEQLSSALQTISELTRPTTN